MRIPVPRNRLVALTLLGIVLTGLLSVALASPSVLPSIGETDGEDDLELERDAPSPNSDFTPSVRTQQSEYEEHEEYEEDDHDDREDEPEDDHEEDDHDDDHEEDDD